MSVKSTLDAEPVLREHHAKSTPPYLRELLTELSARAVVRLAGVDQPPIPIDRFEAMLSLGSGGYGAVIEAWDPKFERAVALKLCVNVKNDENDKAAKQLLAEARAVARIQHPNVITIYETGQFHGNLFLVMEFAAGGSLGRRAIETERMSWRRLLPIFADIARGLAAAHAEGVTHGDIKPSNILLHANGRPVIADFGLARVMGGPPLLPKAIGTLLYAAPEVLRFGPRRQSPLADQWSFFVTLWECLDRRLPFLSNQELRQVLLEIREDDMLWLIEDQWPGPSTLMSEVPAGLREILAVGLSLEPAERFPNMLAVAEALDNLMASENAAASEVPVLALVAEVPEVESAAADDAVAMEVPVLVTEGEVPEVEPAVSKTEVPEVEPAISDEVVLEPSADTDTDAPGGKGLKGAGIAVLLVVAIGGLLAELYVVKHNGETEPNQATRAPTPAERGQQKIQAASEIVKSVRNLTEQELDLTVELWRQGADLIRLSDKPSDKELAAQLTLTLAADIQARKTGTKHATALATQAAQWHEAEEEWDLAVEAQKQAVQYYKAADAPELAWAQGCLANLEADVPCEWNHIEN